MEEKLVRIVCQCDDFVLWETTIAPTCHFTCPNCGRIYTYAGDILEPIEEKPLGESQAERLSDKK